MAKKTTACIRLILTLIALVAILATQVPASASDATQSFGSSDCYGLDIVFIIDQSGSMSGITSGPNPTLPNDPLGNRFYAPRYALDWLANNILGLCSGAVHRVGVVSFGTESQIDLPLTKISPSSQEDWNRAREIMNENIQPRDLDATDPAKAFEQAAMMLRAAPPLGTLPRKQAIIALTDGKACVPTLGCRAATGDNMDHVAYNNKFVAQIVEDFSFSEALSLQDQALREASQQYGGLGNIPVEVKNQILRENPVTPDDLAESTYIWIVAMNSADPFLEIDGDALLNIADSHGGELIALPENRIGVPSVFNKILSWLSGVSPTVLGCGKLAVDPYLGGATLDVYKAGEGYALNISYNGRSLESGQGDLEYFGVVDYSQFGVIEHYRFEKPPAGLWDVTASDCQSIEVSYLPFRAKVMMVEPVSALPIYNLDNATSDPVHPFYLKFKITDQNETLTLDADPLFPLDMRAVVGLPDGGSTTLQFEFVQNGLWKSTSPLPVNMLGDYIVDVSAWAPCIENPDIVGGRCPEPTFLVFQDATGLYHVDDVLMFDFNILYPREDDVLPLHGNLWPEQLALQPVSVVMQVVDGNGLPIPASQVLVGDLNGAFRAKLVAENGEFTEVLMQPDPVDPSRFLATFDVPAVLGEHLLTVTLLSDYQFETYSPVRKEVQLNFSRADSLLRNPDFYRVAGIILALLVLGLVALIVSQGRNAVQGRLILTDITTNLQKTHPLNKGKRTVTITQGLPAKVKKITVRNAGVRSGKQLIQVKVIPVKGSVVPKTIPDGQELSLTGELKAKYEWGGRPKKSAR